MKQKTIITIRHTQSEHHISGMTGGVSYWNLTELGKQQAYKIGQWLSENEKLDNFKMISSDLPRTAQTAQEICKSNPLVPAYSEKLREIDLGEGNGTTQEWYKKNISPKPEVYDPTHRSFPSAENDVELWARMKAFYETLLNSNEDNFVLISHGGALMFLQLVMMGRSLADVNNSYYFGSAGSVSKFIISEDGSCQVEYLNKEVI
ncbi:MAG: phosphoglycerate mutase family protein [Treponema sp.]|nr:phosphoglycerate mutase family protein [Treponema sp.]